MPESKPLFDLVVDVRGNLTQEQQETISRVVGIFLMRASERLKGEGLRVHSYRFIYSSRRPSRG